MQQAAHENVHSGHLFILIIEINKFNLYIAISISMVLLKTWFKLLKQA